MSELKPEFDVALSFAGEDRVYVEQVADRLRGAGVKVFYDTYEKGARRFSTACSTTRPR